MKNLIMAQSMSTTVILQILLLLAFLIVSYFIIKILVKLYKKVSAYLDEKKKLDS